MGARVPTRGEGMSEKARHLAIFPRDAVRWIEGGERKEFSYATGPAVCNQSKFTNGATMHFTNDPEEVTCSKCLGWLKAVPA